MPVRSRFGLLVHIEQSHSDTHQGFWINVLFRFILINYIMCLDLVSILMIDREKKSVVRLEVTTRVVTHRVVISSIHNLKKFQMCMWLWFGREKSL